MKIVPIRASAAEAGDMELQANVTALDMTLEQIAEQAPELRAIGWVVDGNCGSVATIREHNSRVMVIQHDSREQCKALARALSTLPDLVLHTIRVELDMICVDRDMRAAYREETGQDAPEAPR